MDDIALVLGAIVFFALCAAYVRALDRMVTSTEDLNDTAEVSR